MKVVMSLKKNKWLKSRSDFNYLFIVIYCVTRKNPSNNTDGC